MCFSLSQSFLQSLESIEEILVSYKIDNHYDKIFDKFLVTILIYNMHACKCENLLKCTLALYILVVIIFT